MGCLGGTKQGTTPNLTSDPHFLRFWSSSDAILSHLGRHLDSFGEASGPKNIEKLHVFTFFQQNAILVILDVLTIILGHLGTIFGHSGATLGHLDRILGHVGAIWSHLGTICDLSWDDLGPSWDHFLLFWGTTTRNHAKLNVRCAFLQFLDLFRCYLEPF